MNGLKVESGVGRYEVMVGYGYGYDSWIDYGL